MVGSMIGHRHSAIAETRFRRLRPAPLVTLAAYAAVAWAYFVLPLQGRFREALLGFSYGLSPFPYDPVLNAGILEWGRRALITSSLDLFEWPAGYPLHNSLAITEHLIGWQPGFALIRAAGGSVASAYNAVFVASFVLSAAGARLLAKEFGADEEGAFLSGLIFGFLPFHLTHAVHLQTLAIWCAPFAFLFLDRFLRRGGLFNLVGAAASCALCLLSGMYIGLFLVIGLSLYVGAALVAGRASLDVRRLVALAAAGFASFACLWPILSHYVAFSQRVGYAHPLSVLTRFSLELTALIKVPAWQALWASTGYKGVTWHESAAFPGLVTLALVLCAFGRRARNASGPVLRLLLLMTLIFFVLSLGPRLLVFENTPVAYAEWLPLPGLIFARLSAIRWPMRAFLLSALFGSVVAGLGFAAATSAWPRARRVIACALVAGALVVEYRPKWGYAGESLALPDPLAFSGAYPFLASEQDRGAVVELPAADPNGYRTPMLVRSVYGSAGHLRRVIAIHGSVVPPLTSELLHEADRLPDESAVDHLRRYGCTRVVVHRFWQPGPRIDDQIARMRAAGLPVLWESDEAVTFALR